MYRTKYAIVAAAVVIGMIVSHGCDKGQPSAAPVLGKVTYQSKPVVAGRIMFYPENGRPAVGDIGPDGAYRLTTNPDKPGDGAMPGKHRVTIEANRLVGGQQPKSLADEQRMFRAGVPRLEWLVPEKYSNPGTSNLTAEVKPGPNVIDFDL